MKEIKAFITNDSFIDNTYESVSQLMEISPIALSYSKNVQQYYSTDNSLYSLYLFKASELNSLSQVEVDDVIRIITALSSFLTTTQITNKQQIIISFSNDYNILNPTAQVSNLLYNNTIDFNNIRAVDYISFTVNDINCEIWLSDAIFKTFYPHYEINCVLPFGNFSSIVNNTSNFITALDNFNLLDFNSRIEENKNNKPTTYTKILNIQYKVPNTSVYKDCYFGFNIYGLQGNYDYILKLELYAYLTDVLGLTGSVVEQLFPSILNINEFFITPRWDKIAIPSQVGQASINSQLTFSYNETFDLDKFIKVYTDLNYLRNNTYNLPFDYNNILLQVTNGFYTEASIKDFKNYFNDFITITSSHPDFARMRLETQRFVTLLENMLVVSNANNSTELFNNLIINTDYKFTIINRGGVNYLSFFFGQHQIYLLPRYEFLNLL